MKRTQLHALALASALAFNCAVAQTKDAPAEPAEPAAKAAVEAPKPQVNIDELLALIPEYFGEYTIDGKTEKISSANVKTMLAEQIKMATAQGQAISPDMIKQLIPQMAESEVMKKALPAYVKLKGFKGDEAQAKAQVEQLKAQLAQNKMTMDTFFQRSGIKSEQELFDRIMEESAISKFQESIEATIKIEEKEVKDFYDANAAQMKYYECAHILALFNNKQTAPTPEEDAAALKKINDILAKLNAGEDFVKLAEEFSDCPSGKQSKGVVGKYNPEQKMPQGEMVQEFTDAFNALKPGEMTKAPVKTQFGYHIIKASNVIELSFDSQKEKITDFIKQQKMQAKVPEIIADVKKTLGVKTFAEAK